MRHVSDGVLRRRQEEPFAVPDAAGRHLETCGRCRASSGQIAEDAALASRLLATPPPAEDTDAAWAQLQRQLELEPAARRPARRQRGAALPAAGGERPRRHRGGGARPCWWPAGWPPRPR